MSDWGNSSSEDRKTRAKQLLFLITRKDFSKLHPEIENTKIIFRLVGWSGLAAVTHTHTQNTRYVSWISSRLVLQQRTGSFMWFFKHRDKFINILGWHWSNIFLKRSWTSRLKHLLTYRGTTRQVSTVKHRFCPKWKWITSKAECIWCLINSWEVQELKRPTKCHSHILGFHFSALHLVRAGWETQKKSFGQVNEACRERFNMWRDPRWLHVSSLFFSQQKPFIIPREEDRLPSVSAASFLNL